MFVVVGVVCCHLAHCLLFVTETMMMMILNRFFYLSLFLFVFLFSKMKRRTSTDDFVEKENLSIDYFLRSFFQTSALNDARQYSSFL